MPDGLSVSLDRGGSLRLGASIAVWPNLPADLARLFSQSEHRRIFVRAEPGVPGWELREAMRTLRRYSHAAACAAPSGLGRTTVVVVPEPALPVPERVSVARWLVTRFLRAR